MGHLWTFGALILGSILSGEACTCVNSIQCREVEPLYIWRVLKHHGTMACPAGQICCAILWNSNERNTETPPVVPVTSPPNVPRTIHHNWGSKDTTVVHAAPPSTEGKSNPCGLDATKTIRNGHSLPGQFPWVIALLHNGAYFGGGSLIAPGFVLTAAHFLRYKSAHEIVVRAGEWDLNSPEESFAPEEREVEKIVSHPNFDFKTGANNLAILHLKSPFELKHHIRTISIPMPQSSYDGQRCTVAGWGKRNFEDFNYSAVLKKVELPVVSRNDCESKLQRAKLGSNYKLPASMICAGGEPNQDTCTGDGGSALFCSLGDENPDSYVQVGIVVWGLDCGQKDIPATYTNVAIFREWIENNMLPYTFRNGAFKMDKTHQ
ncbi:phenoloxidase-activating factor 2-like isoform X2 [Drosophila gunungcola]|uniref:phenoloxidase-activating factor 2-like isoform X2 n=1 Tax=Drosophila gunungcola TaxID=103775 RepID=UPI0022E75275|nr:phenoloxidase-activating factor 2-like isoform X2 [Drosophila gunungcola]